MGLFDKVNEIKKDRDIDKKVNNFFDNSEYIKRITLRYAHDSVDINKIKAVIRSEMDNPDYESFKINQRFMELLKMDVNTVYDLHLKGVDTSQFVLQKDLDNYFGESYAKKYQKEYDEMYAKSEHATPIKNVKTLPKDYIKPKKEEPVKFGPKLKGYSSHVNKSHKKRERVSEDKHNTDYEKEEVASAKKDDIPKEKRKLIRKGHADIEIFKKVKSNTALASAALFLATGVLVAEAKEEMKWVKTKLEIKDYGIKIKRPYLFHKYSDFRYFKVNQEDDYYLFSIGFDDENLIHFRTKEKYLHEVIMEKIQETNLSYESLL